MVVQCQLLPAMYEPCLTDNVKKPTETTNGNAIVRHRIQKRPSFNSCFSNNHIMVNDERARHGLKPYHRSRFLDDLARWHAEEMANECQLRHSVDDIDTLKQKLKSDQVGENVLQGSSIRLMHSLTMCQDSPDRRNLLSTVYTEFGCGTAKGADGQLYMVQLVRKA